MKGDSQHGARRHGRQTTSSNFILCFCSNVDVTVELGSSTFIDNVLFNFGVSDDGRILLTGRDGCAVASKVRIDCVLSE